MTSSITPITAASNGGDTTTTTERKAPEHGVRVLRLIEARALISLGTQALSEASNLGHDMHRSLYDKDASMTNPELQDQLAEALTCMETAEHYLLMLGSVFEEHPARNRPPAAVPE
jgi:2-hydroxychromene-2-carboxylate isomerase